MVPNNAYKMYKYKALLKQHTPEWSFLNMSNVMRELTHNLCQRGLPMRKRRAQHPSWTPDMRKLFGWIAGQKVCLDTKGMMMVLLVLVMQPVQDLPDNYVLLKNLQQRLLWRIHQSKTMMKNGGIIGKIA